MRDDERVQLLQILRALRLCPFGQQSLLLRAVEPEVP
jgi:hypothetical protein